MNHFFPKLKFFYYLLLGIFLFGFKIKQLYFPYFFVLVFILLLFRKKNGVNFQDLTSSASGLFSPVNGKIMSIQKHVDHDIFGNDLNVIQIRMDIFDEYGILLPLTSEVKDLRFKDGNSFWRNKLVEIADASGPSFGLGAFQISFSDSIKSDIGMEFYRCQLGLWPRIWVLPGDRGKSRACIGYLPFGGTVLLYLPNNFEILVHEGEQLVSGESIVAGHLES